VFDNVLERARNNGAGSCKGASSIFFTAGRNTQARQLPGKLSGVVTNVWVLIKMY